MTNREVIEAVYAGWSGGDFTGGLSLFHSEAVLVLRSPLPDAGNYEGVEAIAGYTRSFLEPWSELTIAPDEFTDAGEQVLVNVTQRGVGTASGIPAELNYFHLWWIRDGLVVRMESIRDRADALEAAGLGNGS